MGGSFMSWLYEGFCDSWWGENAGLKLSKGLDSGGDIRLETDGKRFMFVLSLRPKGEATVNEVIPTDWLSVADRQQTTTKNEDVSEDNRESHCWCFAKDIVPRRRYLTNTDGMCLWKSMEKGLGNVGKAHVKVICQGRLFVLWVAIGRWHRTLSAIRLTMTERAVFDIRIGRYLLRSQLGRVGECRDVFKELEGHINRASLFLFGI